MKQTLRGQWVLAQSDEIKSWAKSGDVTFRLAPSDGLVEKKLVEPGTGVEVWVPVVPDGAVGAGQSSWRRWVFLQTHAGVFGGHRLAAQTLRILHRVAWWPKASADLPMCDVHSV